MAKRYNKHKLQLAQKAQNKDEVPVGCVIVKDNKIIARGHNLKEKNCNEYEDKNKTLRFIDEYSPFYHYWLHL